MGKVLFLIVAVVASLAVVEPLICNNCPFSLFGFCISPSNVSCAPNVTQCFTKRLTFPSLTNFTGFSTYGCAFINDTCGKIKNGTVETDVGLYDFNTTCCTKDHCNSIFSGAPTTKMTFAAAIGGALLASVWGSML